MSNLVTGLGPVVGEAISAHPDVDMVSFTGSTAAGKQVMAVAAETVNKVSLEVGGKSAFVVLDDADLAKAVKVGLANCFINGGRRASPGPAGSCRPTATTRCSSCSVPGRRGL